MKKILSIIAFIITPAFAADSPNILDTPSIALGSVTGMGTGCATWLATPSSANLAGCVTDETGTGSVVFSASPTFTGSAIVEKLRHVTSVAISAQGDSGYNSATGYFIWPKAGSSYDLFVYNSAGNQVMSVLTGTQNLSLAGGLTVTNLTTAAGTPNSICQNSATKEITVNAALTCTVSSRDYKGGIKPFMSDALMMVSAMRPETFHYRDRPERDRIGFMAEELAAIDPRLAEWTNDGKANSIDFPAIMGVLVKAVQQLKNEIDSLRFGRVANSH